MSTPAQAPRAARADAGSKINRFWQRVTDGMQLDQLWDQFQSDTRAGYRFYAKEINQDRVAQMSGGRRFFYTAEQFFWAVLEKLSPARRVLLLVGVVLFVLRELTFSGPHTQVG